MKKGTKTVKLEERIELFVAAYLADMRLDGVAAARAAGYDGDENVLAVQAYRLLSREDVRESVRKAIQKRVKRTEVTQDKVVLELARIAFADLTEVAEWDSKGVLKVKPSAEIKKRAARALKELKHKVVAVGDVAIETTVEVKFHDKIRALELLMKHLGMLDDEDSDAGDQENKPKVLFYYPEAKPK